MLYVNKNKRTCFNFSLLSEMRHSYLRCPTSISDTIPVCECVYVTIGNPAFCLFLYFTGVHFRGELQHGGDVIQQKIKCRPIRTREIRDVSLSDVLYDTMGSPYSECSTLCSRVSYSNCPSPYTWLSYPEWPYSV